MSDVTKQVAKLHKNLVVTHTIRSVPSNEGHSQLVSPSSTLKELRLNMCFKLQQTAEMNAPHWKSQV